MNSWNNIIYLKDGNRRQQLAYSVISEFSILRLLQQYSPIVVGTIPIEIDILGSDLDIICNVSDFKPYQKLIHTHFSHFEGFQDEIKNTYYVANFYIKELPIEIYAENKPTTMQYAYIHMLVESRLLNILGNSFREKIIELKLQGYKTEPAFGHLLGLENAYTELLDLVDFSDKQLFDFVTSKRNDRPEF